MIFWLRHSKVAMWGLTILRIYLGFGWAKDGFEKLTGPKPFDASGLIMSAIKHPVTDPSGVQRHSLGMTGSCQHPPITVTTQRSFHF